MSGMWTVLECRPFPTQSWLPKFGRYVVHQSTLTVVIKVMSMYADIMKLHECNPHGSPTSLAGLCRVFLGM